MADEANNNAASPGSNGSGTKTPEDPQVVIPDVLEIKDLPELPTGPSDSELKKNPEPAAAYQLETAEGDGGFGTAFNGAKTTLVTSQATLSAAQGVFTAAQQTYAQAVATYNKALQTARATQVGAYDTADQNFQKAIKGC